jgi:hypothetical protein
MNDRPHMLVMLAPDDALKTETIELSRVYFYRQEDSTTVLGNFSVTFRMVYNPNADEAAIESIRDLARDLSEKIKGMFTPEGATNANG